MTTADQLLEKERQEVFELCDKVGFGFVIQQATWEWQRRDPQGAIPPAPKPVTQEQLGWPLAAVMIGLVLVACLFVVGMNMSTAIMVGCR